MNNIIITGDLIRVNPNGEPNQRSNIKWIYNLINWQIASVVKEANLKVVLPELASDEFSIIDFYKKCGLENKEASWIKIYDEVQVPEAALVYFRQKFSGNFVIGYELPDVFISLFDRLEINYLDLAIHPVRYLDDIFLGARTNCPKVFSALRTHALPIELYSVYAGICKATVARMSPIDLDKKSCLFVGQTEIDRSQIKNGRLLTLADFEDRVRRMEAQYSRIYFKQHPYAKSKGILFDIVSDPRKIQVIDQNIYRLLASEEIDKIFTLSSSVHYETRYFDKAGEAFFTECLDRFHFDPADPSPDCYVPLLDDFLYPKFWAEVLEPHFRTSCDSILQIPRKTSRLRTTLGRYWGYNFLDAEILFKDIAPKIQGQQAVQGKSGLISFFRKAFPA